MTSNSPLVLVVEDDESIRRITSGALSASRYQVIEAETCKRALAEVAAQHPDVILLDLGLPDMSGLDVIRQLCDSQTSPIVVFSAGGLQHDKVTALELGAVDYIAKPFEVAELLSRLRSVLRRASRRQCDLETHFVFGDLDVDLVTGRVAVSNREVHLTSREVRLLTAFVRNAGCLLTYHSLIQQAWEPEERPSNAELLMNVAQLRQKLEPNPVRPRYLFADIGVGYRFREA